ncbi:hypothetical protein CALCODRAFT_187580 [Calocera cornea HHB12733]|uniref:Uncharacterized protein n=1 Tax=Calocera cornea HHB12733 TaxID=1353952 RepID=A0A165HQ57_9BASI|nr:hypothetical protein CALCODRAFT_187580 [Calocera cornea HHB12733]
MCERPFAPFYRVEVKDEKHITVIDPAELQKLRETTLNPRERAFMKAWEKITTWSSFAYEEWRDNQSPQKPSRPTTVTFEDPASLTLQSAFPSLLYEATYSLEELLSSSTQAPSSLGLTNGHHANGHAAPPRTTLQSILDLATSHARILLHIWAMTAALDAPANQGMRTWLQGLPAVPSPVPGSPVTIPSPSASSVVVQSQALKSQLTPPSSPRPVKRLKEEKAAAEKQKEEREREDKLAEERDSLARKLEEVERKFELAAKRLGELEAEKENERGKELDAQLAEVKQEEEGPALDHPEQEEDVKVDEEDEEDEEVILARLEERRDGLLHPRSPSPDRPAGRRSRSHSPESDSSTIRPSSPLPPRPDPLEEEAERAGLAVRVKAKRFSMARMLLAWSALIVLFAAMWMGAVSAHRAGREVGVDLPGAAWSAIQVLLQTASGGVRMLSAFGP